MPIYAVINLKDRYSRVATREVHFIGGRSEVCDATRVLSADSVKDAKTKAAVHGGTSDDVQIVRTFEDDSVHSVHAL